MTSSEFEKIWERYRSRARKNEPRVREHRNQTLTDGGITMQYYATTIGEKPEGGYPLYIALHGGGGVPVDDNQQAWERMQKQYLGSIRHGVYVVPRGITDTWDMHFQPKSYVFYDRLIENMILYEDVNPDKVYLLGYSAGGDAVYQISPRMADRFAAVNMSAGHHNDIKFENLSNLPIALQAGEKDTDYDRNADTARADAKLDELATQYSGCYIHTTWIHADGGHRFIDNDPKGNRQSVFNDPHKWLSAGNRETSLCNTNAICWLDQYERNPRPQRVIWDLTTRADRYGQDLWNGKRHGEQYYWLDISDNSAETLGVDTIVVVLEKRSNMITLEKCGKYLRLLLDRQMLDLDRPVTISIGDEIKPVLVIPSRTIQQETVEQRGDPRYIFDGSITVQQTGDEWKISSP